MDSVGRDQAWPGKGNDKQGLRKGALKSWRFWATQAVVATLALAPFGAELIGLPSNMYFLHELLHNLQWLPVLYAAWTFGGWGATLTALLAVLLTVTDGLLTSNGVFPFWEIVEVSLLVTVGLFVGWLVEQREKAHEKARLFASHALHSHEAERLHISRELHDGILQNTVVACQQLDGIRFSAPPISNETGKEVLAVRNSVEQIAGDLRALACGLRPAALDALGVVESIKHHLAGLAERTGAETQFHLVGVERRLPDDVEIGIFRIAHEALRNVERHAKATRVAVTVAFSRDEVVLTVRDNGSGFTMPSSMHALVAEDKLGVLGMFERAELLGGILEISSRPGRGATITATVPLVFHQH